MSRRMFYLTLAGLGLLVFVSVLGAQGAQGFCPTFSAGTDYDVIGDETWTGCTGAGFVHDANIYVQATGNLTIEDSEIGLDGNNRLIVLTGGQLATKDLALPGPADDSRLFRAGPPGTGTLLYVEQGSTVSISRT